jgi:hypothetical protein
MTLSDLQEALGIVTALGNALGATLSGPNVGRPGSLLRQAVGNLEANAEASLRAGAIGAQISACFDLAWQAGASFAAFGQVAAAMLAQAPLGLTGVAVANAGIRFALCKQALIVSSTVFVSRDDVQAMVANVNAAFDPAEEYAADDHDPGTYQAFVALHAAVIRDLQLRAIPLPRLIAFALPRSVPSLTLAQRIYADAGRADELGAENRVIHPAFMPASGQALSQ